MCTSFQTHPCLGTLVFSVSLAYLHFRIVYHNIRVNETLIGATSTDVLFALSADECSMNVGNRMSRLAGHILEQQSFYPMFPAPEKIHPQVR